MGQVEETAKARAPMPEVAADPPGLLVLLVGDRSSMLSESDGERGTASDGELPSEPRPDESASKLSFARLVCSCASSHLSLPRSTSSARRSVDSCSSLGSA